MSKRQTWKDKVHPLGTYGQKRAEGMSDKMVSILLCLIPQQGYTSAIAELLEVSNDHVLARMQGDIGFNTFIGSLDDTRRNLNDWFVAVKLTQQETRSAWTVINRQLSQGGVTHEPSNKDSQ